MILFLVLLGNLAFAETLPYLDSADEILSSAALLKERSAQSTELEPAKAEMFRRAANLGRSVAAQKLFLTIQAEEKLKCTAVTGELEQRIKAETAGVQEMVVSISRQIASAEAPKKNATPNPTPAERTISAPIIPPPPNPPPVSPPPKGHTGEVLVPPPFVNRPSTGGKP